MKFKIQVIVTSVEETVDKDTVKLSAIIQVNDDSGAKVGVLPLGYGNAQFNFPKGQAGVKAGDVFDLPQA